MAKPILNEWQQCFIDRLYDGKLPRTKIGKEELELLSYIKETVTVIYPETPTSPERTQFLVVTKDYCNFPQNHIDVVTLAGNLRLWKSRNYLIYTDGEQLFNSTPVVQNVEPQKKNSSLPIKTISLNDLYWAIEQSPLSEQEKKRFIKIAREVPHQFQSIPKETSEQKEEDIEIAGILYKYGEDDYDLWEGFVFSPEEMTALSKILEPHETEGCSVRGSMADIIEELQQTPTSKLQK